MTGKRTNTDRSKSPLPKKARTASKSPTRAEKEAEEAKSFLGTDFDSSSRRSAAQVADEQRKDILAPRGRSKSPVSGKGKSKTPVKPAKSPKRAVRRSKSPIRVAVKPIRSGLKRMSTMDETASEAMAFLAQEGSKDLLTTSSTLPETRNRTRARVVLEEMMSDVSMELLMWI